MKNVIFALAMVLMSQTAKAGVDQKAVDLGYLNAKDVVELGCEALTNWILTQPACKALRDRLNTGHLVVEGDYRSRCGVADEFLKMAKKYTDDYKKVYGQRFAPKPLCNITIK